jgi:hypothetical protein
MHPVRRYHWYHSHATDRLLRPGQVGQTQPLQGFILPPQPFNTPLQVSVLRVEFTELFLEGFFCPIVSARTSALRCLNLRDLRCAWQFARAGDLSACASFARMKVSILGSCER